MCKTSLCVNSAAAPRRHGPVLKSSVSACLSRVYRICWLLGSTACCYQPTSIVLLLAPGIALIALCPRQIPGLAGTLKHKVGCHTTLRGERCFREAGPLQGGGGASEIECQGAVSAMHASFLSWIYVKGRSETTLHASVGTWAALLFFRISGAGAWSVGRELQSTGFRHTVWA